MHGILKASYITEKSVTSSNQKFSGRVHYQRYAPTVNSGVSSFYIYISGLVSTSIQSVEVPNKKSLSSYLQKVYELMVKEDQGNFGRSLPSIHNSRCLDGTAPKLPGYEIFHWIDYKSSIIACICVIGCHTSDVLADNIEEVHRPQDKRTRLASGHSF